jgi:hypothetical protein
MLRSVVIDSQTRKFINKIIFKIQGFVSRRDFAAIGSDIFLFPHNIEVGTLLYPISCLWLLGDVGNMVKTISAHSQIISH